MANLQTEPTIYLVNNGLNPLPYKIEVKQDPETEQYFITMYIANKRFTRIEKTIVRAVIYAKQMNENLELAFRYTWEDNT